MSEAQAMDLGALSGILGKDISEIEDLPSYVTPPPGVYKLKIDEAKIDSVGKEEKTILKVTYSIIDNIELNDPEDAKDLPKAGDKMSEAFFFDDPEKQDLTLGILKQRYGGLAEACGSTNLQVIIEKMVGMEIQCKVSQRLDKTDKTKVYAQLRDIVPATA